MKILIFENAEDAVTRSRDAWEATLGRKKHPEDITEFLWSVVEHPQSKQGAVVLEDNEKPELTTAEEKAALITKADAELAGWFQAVDVIGADSSNLNRR